MTKRVYGELFQHMADCVNAVLSASGSERHKFIGVLDIFGFESLEVNSSEQLCINYCNEKFTHNFISMNKYFVWHQSALYGAEGIKISATSLQDDQPALDSLDVRVTGIVSVCDEISEPEVVVMACCRKYH